MGRVTGRDEPYDAIVVGSGITGGWAAKELCEKGLRTLVVERGRHLEHGKDYVTEWLQPWELPLRGRGEREMYERDYPIQSKNYAFGEATRHFFVNDREHPYVTPDGKPFRWIRGYQLGGRSLLWGRACWRWSDLDFEANARDGYGVDWPIRYQDIAPWYAYVERFVGVSGERLGLPHLPDGELLPPWELNCGEQLVRQGIERAFPGRRMTVTRVANLTQEHNGRGRCQARDQCARGCSFGAYFSSLSATLPAARKTGKLTTVNASGELGHNLMDHISKAGARGIVPGLEDKYVYGRRPTGAYIPRFRNLGVRGEDQFGFIRGYGIQAGAGRQGWSRGASMPGFGAEFKQRLREPGPWRITMQGYGECLPRHENYVDLDPERKDQWGIPLLRVHCSWSTNERAIREDVKTQAAEMLEAAGCREVDTYDDDGPPGFSVHEMGTARMGRDPKTSVLNGFNQAHDVPNLFITDGSCMTSSSCVNPSITYMALTARAVDYAVGQLTRQAL
ncbi:MAG: GMC family oxidoreductase [Gemmatimonadetes bacterium]|nr:GMC family oxidoreductase [Gemmatimonadota bacterium]